MPGVELLYCIIIGVQIRTRDMMKVVVTCQAVEAWFLFDRLDVIAHEHTDSQTHRDTQRHWERGKAIAQDTQAS